MSSVTITNLPHVANTSSHVDPLAIERFDHVEILCGNAKQAAYFYQHAFGFSLLAYRGPETGFRQGVSYVMSQGEVRLVLSSPIAPEASETHFLGTHGDSPRAVAFAVPDCTAFYHAALARGAESVEAPRSYQDGYGEIKRAAIRTYGDVVHPLIERGTYSGSWFPGFQPADTVFSHLAKAAPLGLEAIDHVVGNVELGRMNEWVSFYEKVLDFKQLTHFSDKEISTEYSALMSKVMMNGSGRIKLPINEPAEGKRKSQIEEYLQFHHGPGVQHVALRTTDIITTVTALRARGIGFLRVPQTYYDEAPARIGTIKEDLKKLSELGILVDRDEDGYLLQIFTKPLQDRPTLFFEVIQREGSKGFGVGNFKALFEAIEREQAARGNL